MNKLSDFLGDIENFGSGDKYRPCPICSPFRRKSRLPCLHIKYNEHGNHIWGCAHCGFSGSVFKGVMNPGCEYPIPDMKKKKSYIKPVYTESGLPPKEMQRYWLSRGLSKRTYEEYKIGWEKREVDKKEIHFFKFPYLRNEEVVNIKYRGLEEKLYFQTKDAEKIPYGLDDIKDAKIFYIVEGEWDKLTLAEIGEKRCISVPNGAPSPESKNYISHFDWLYCIEKNVQDASCIIIATDNDSPGINLREELALRLGKEKCYYVEFPPQEHLNDPNGYLRTYGKAALASLIAQAKEYPLEGIIEIRSVETELDHIFEHGIEPGYKTQWEEFNKFYSIVPGNFTTVTGFPGSGKSQWVEDLVLGLVKSYGMRVGIFSPEHSIHVNILRIAQKYIGKGVKINNGKSPEHEDYMSNEEWQEAKNFIANNIFWIIPDRKKRMSPEHLFRQKELLVKKYGCRLFIDDPYNRLEHARKKEQTIEEYLSEFLEEYLDFNERFKSHSFLVTHPKNNNDPGSLSEKVKWDENRQTFTRYPSVSARDISGGAMFWNKSPYIISVNRPGQFISESRAEFPTMIHILKIKEEEWYGKQGRVSLYHDKKTGKFYERPITELF